MPHEPKLLEKPVVLLAAGTGLEPELRPDITWAKLADPALKAFELTSFEEEAERFSVFPDKLSATPLPPKS